MIKVSIIIPHYNNQDILISCIDSLQKLDYVNYEIIVVNNNSTDGSIEYVKNNYQDIIIVSAKKNLGYAGGCNLGAQQANGEYLLFLNNDTIHEKNFLDILVSRLDDNRDIASIQPKILNIKNKNYFDYAGAAGGYLDYLVFPFTRGRIFNTIEKDTGQYDDFSKIFWASGAGFITRKNVFNKINGFDNSLFAHMEEIDYHWKSYLMGFEVWVEPKSIIYHHGGKTLSYMSSIKTYLNHRNSLILLLSNYHLGLSIYLFLIRFFLEILSSIKELCSLRISHFIAHYKSLLWVLFNIKVIKRKRKEIAKIRIKSDIELMNDKVILNKSIVKIYYIFLKKKYSEIIK